MQRHRGAEAEPRRHEAREGHREIRFRPEPRRKGERAYWSFPWLKPSVRD
jgi:hypothetical protein